MEKNVQIHNVMKDLFDNHFAPTTPSYKLARKDNPSTSKESAKHVNTTKLENIVLNVIKRFGEGGCISDDVRKVLAVEEPKLSYSSITARYSALCDKCLIDYTGEKRKGDSGRSQRVMIARSWI
jgi:hypothetical protein